MRKGPPEIHFKVMGITISAKGEKAIDAVRGPVLLLVSIAAPVLAVGGGYLVWKEVLPRFLVP